MPANLLDDTLIEVSRVTQQRASDVVGVLQALEGIIREGELGALPELHPLVLVVEVDVLHPAVVSSGGLGRDMLLEHDNVGVWDLFRVRGREDWSCAVVNRVNDDG